MVTRLPVVGSTAASTAFCTAELKLSTGHTLVFDGNGKITAGNGTLAAPRPNALSLAAASVDQVTGPGTDCPGSTPTCRASCYVTSLAAAQPELYAAYLRNTEVIEDLLAAHWRTRRLCATHDIARWIRQHAAGGFRWHVSGDVLNVSHAIWIADVCYYTPNIRHWIYTRTLDAVPVLLGAPNLAVNISADRDNYRDARAVALRTGARLTYLVDASGVVPDDMPTGSVIFPDYSLRAPRPGSPQPGGAWQSWYSRLQPSYKQMVCPVDAHGKSERRRCGPCDRCLKP